MLAFDIQLEIIKWLPVKSLIQCRSVCKAWKSFIDSSRFITGYNVGHDQKQHLMITYTVGDWDELNYVGFVDDDDDTLPQQKFAPNVPWLLDQLYLARIIDSSHGVLGFYGYFTEPENMVVLWNPTIRKSIAVDVPNMEVHGPFDSVVGFGVCPNTKDPKLVKITYIAHRRKKEESISCSIPCCQVMVFTFSSREWTCLSTNHHLPRKSIQFTWSQAVIGQFIYWLAYDWINVDGGFRKLIMSFDLSTQEFREVELPDSLLNVWVSDLFVSRLRESLVLLQYKQETINKQVCDVWMMDPKAFTKLFTISAPDASVSWTLGFRMNGQPIIATRDDHNDFETPCAHFVYEPCSQHFMDLGVRGNSYSFYGRSYTESLLLLDHDDGHIVRCGAVKR